MKINWMFSNHFRAITQKPRVARDLIYSLTNSDKILIHVAHLLWPEVWLQGIKNNVSYLFLVNYISVNKKYTIFISITIFFGNTVVMLTDLFLNFRVQ